MENKYFYCYSLKLKNFLKLQGISYYYEAKHSNGNRYWTFISSNQLNEALTNWNKYKQIFIKKGDYINDRKAKAICGNLSS